MDTGDSYLSDLHHLGEILSESSQLNLAGIQQFNNIDDMNVSDDEDEANSESDDSTITEIGILDKIPIKFAYIDNGDIVELSAVGSDLVLWVRATKYDELYERILIDINKSARKTADTAFDRLEKGDVILVRYNGDYSRGIVEADWRACDAKISVQMLDVGVTLNIDPNSVRKFHPSMIEPRLAVPLRLKLPQGITATEQTAVENVLAKHRFNRFRVQRIDFDLKEITAHSTIDLISIRDDKSLLSHCLNKIQKRFSIEDIGEDSIGQKSNVSLTVIEQIDMKKGFLCFIQTTDLQTFAQRFHTLCEHGKLLDNKKPYSPNKGELCLVCHPDPDGSFYWYRAEYQIELANARAQVRLIDFCVTAVVEASKIRKFDDQFIYNKISFIGKIRSNCSLELLSRELFDPFNTVMASVMRPAGNGFEIYLDREYFFIDENFEEEILLAEDLLQQVQQQPQPQPQLQNPPQQP